MASRRFAFSAQQLDPLSWFTGPLTPLVFAALGLAYGGAAVIATWNTGDSRLLQPVAVALCAGAGLIIHFATLPLRRSLGWAVAGLALVVSAAGMVLSAIGYAGTAFSLELWWAPGAFALTIASLGPYLPVRTVIVLGSSVTIVAVAVSLVILYPTGSIWGPLGTGVIIAASPVLGIVATATFAHAVVSRMLSLLENPPHRPVQGRTERPEPAESVEQLRLASLTARATPFLEKVAAAGQVTLADRELAGQLARSLRDELVTQSNLSWLDSIASQSRLVVVDPDRRARRMNTVQRMALRGILRAILDTPGIESGSLVIELRPAADGATAVGVRLGMTLPEGRRVMHLAPYYLTLKSAVEDLTLDRRGLLRLSFRVPAGEDSP